MNVKLLRITAIAILLSLLVAGCGRSDCSDASAENGARGSAESSQDPYTDRKLTVTEDRKDGKPVKTAARGQTIRIKGEFAVARADRTPPGLVTFVITRKSGKDDVTVNSKTVEVKHQEGRHVFEDVIKVPANLNPRSKHEIQIWGARRGEKARVIMKQPIAIK